MFIQKYKMSTIINTNNEIICEYNDIRNKNDMQILNCFEQLKKISSLEWEENEKEIKEIRSIHLNEKKIDF